GRELDLGQEPLGADHRCELGPEDLHSHPTGVANVLGEVDGRHPARTDFALEAITVGEGRLEAGQQLGHGAAWLGVGEDAWETGWRPAAGGQPAGTRPAVIVSLDALNQRLQTVTICPLTSHLHPAW